MVIQARVAKNPIYVSNKDGSHVIRVVFPKDCPDIDRGKYYRAKIHMAGAPSVIESDFALEENQKSMFNTIIEGAGLYIVHNDQDIPRSGEELSIELTGPLAAPYDEFETFKAAI